MKYCNLVFPFKMKYSNIIKSNTTFYIILYNFFLFSSFPQTYKKNHPPKLKCILMRHWLWLFTVCEWFPPPKEHPHCGILKSQNSWTLLGTSVKKKKPTKLDSNTSKQTARKGERFSRMENHTSTLQSTHNREDIAQYWIAPNTCPLTGWEILLCLLPNSVSCFILSKKKNKRILTITKEEFHNKVRIILQELRFHPKWQKENAWGAVYSMDFFF